MLTSFEITGYRAFSSLHIPRLGHVNLLVGNNGVGKSSLLEALQLYASKASLGTLKAILQGRDEFSCDAEATRDQLDPDSVFHRHGHNGPSPAIRLGCPTCPEMPWICIRTGIARRIPLQPGEQLVGYRWQELQNDAGITSEDARVLIVEVGPERRVVPVQTLTSRKSLLREPALAIVPTHGIGEKELASWWDLIALHGAEQRVIDCLSPFAPIENVSFVEPAGRPLGRKPMARLRGSQAPVPLGSLGGGIVHMLQIALAMEYAAMGVSDTRTGAPATLIRAPLFIDEIENGIHYSLHKRVWSFVLRLAAMHDLQVFATTHSWDCVEGFQSAASESDLEGLLIRLEHQEGRCRAVIYDENELTTATKEDIEVR